MCYNILHSSGSENVELIVKPKLVKNEYRAFRLEKDEVIRSSRFRAQISEPLTKLISKIR